MKRSFKWFDHVLSYNYMYFDCILVVRHSDGGHGSD